MSFFIPGQQKMALQIAIYFCGAWMHCIRSILGFIQELFLNLLITWHTDSSTFVSQHSIFLYEEVWLFILQNVILDFFYHRPTNWPPLMASMIVGLMVKAISFPTTTSISKFHIYFCNCTNIFSIVIANATIFQLKASTTLLTLPTIIVIYHFQPYSLPYIQFLLSEDVFQIFIVNVYITIYTIQVMPPHLQWKHDNSQF